jgi:acyl carrier protein
MLPDYMVPSYFVTLDRLPLTPNGKLDKASLPDPLSQRSRDAEHATPSNQYEALICQIFSELTGVENVGPEDNFFEIGGHSLLAITLITELRDKFSLDLDLEKIFEDSTPRGLAAHVRLLSSASPDPEQAAVGQTTLQPGLGIISETTSLTDKSGCGP